MAKKKWSGDIVPKWKPPKGLFTKSAEEIAKVLKASTNSFKTAMSRLSLYVNRGGTNLSQEDQDKYDLAKEKLRKLFKRESFWNSKLSAKEFIEKRYQEDLE